MKKLFLGIAMMIPFFSGAADSEMTPDSLLGRYDSVSTFIADFSQTYVSKITKTKKSRTGKIYYRQPAFIRIDAESEGELIEQTFINSDDTVFIYHAKKNVLKKKHTEDIEAYLVFLRGIKQIKKQFTVKDSTDNISVAREAGMKIPPESTLLKLTPRDTVKNINYIFLIGQKNEISSVVIIDSLHNMNQFVFSRITYNKKLKTNRFKPSWPKSYDVSTF